MASRKSLNRKKRRLLFSSDQTIVIPIIKDKTKSNKTPVKKEASRPTISSKK